MQGKDDKPDNIEPDKAMTDNRSNIPLFSSTELFNNSTEIEIEHQGHHYRLRITKQGKLILTK